MANWADKEFAKQKILKEFESNLDLAFHGARDEMSEWKPNYNLLLRPEVDWQVLYPYLLQAHLDQAARTERYRQKVGDEQCVCWTFRDHNKDKKGACLWCLKQ